MTSRRTANRRGRPKWPVPREGRATGGLIAALTLGVAALGGCGGDSADGAASAKPAAKGPRLTVDQSVGRIVCEEPELVACGRKEEAGSRSRHRGDPHRWALKRPRAGAGMARRAARARPPPRAAARRGPGRP